MLVRTDFLVKTNSIGSSARLDDQLDEYTGVSGTASDTHCHRTYGKFTYSEEFCYANLPSRSANYSSGLR